MSDNSQSSFRHIMKGTAIFGGTQMMTILINIVKGKLVACLLGAYGMGISSHLMSTLMPIQQFFTFGLTTSAIKTISSIEDEDRKASYIKTFRTLMLLLASMAAISTFALSYWLSILTFQTSEHQDWLALIAVAVFFFMLASGESTILQGYRRLRYLALSNTAAPLGGLFIAVPIYWIWKYEGIAPSIAILGFISWCSSRFFTKKLNIKPSRQSWSTTLKQGKGMLLLGATIMTTTVIGSVATYLTNTFIGYWGTESDIGFYQAANAITLQCTAMVFAAMGTDYFPHLSSIIKNKRKSQTLVNQEGEIVLLIIVPISLILITIAPLIIRLLLTSEFDTVIFLLRAMAVCVIARATCFPLDYICIAKGDNAYFFFMEGLWTNIKTIALLAVGYYLNGLDGMGIALLIGAAIDISVSMFFNRWRYDIGYSRSFFSLGIPLAFSSILCFASSFISSDLIAYLSMVAITIATSTYCFFQIDKRINLRNLLRQKFYAKS
mgnify:FL=1